MSTHNPDQFSPIQHMFVELFDGSVKRTIEYMARCGCPISYKHGQAIRWYPKVAAAIRDRQKRTMDPMIADRIERQKFWSDTMRDERLPLADRLRASEMLGKSEVDFSERRIIEGGDHPVTYQVCTGISRSPTQPIISEVLDAALS